MLISTYFVTPTRLSDFHAFLTSIKYLFFVILCQLSTLVAASHWALALSRRAFVAWRVRCHHLSAAARIIHTRHVMLQTHAALIAWVARTLESRRRRFAAQWLQHQVREPAFIFHQPRRNKFPYSRHHFGFFPRSTRTAQRKPLPNVLKRERH